MANREKTSEDSTSSVLSNEELNDKNIGRAWRSENAAEATPEEQNILKGIIAVAGYNLTLSQLSNTYMFGVISKNHPDYGSKIIIFDDLGNSWSTPFEIPDKDNGIVKIITDTVNDASFILYIDYRMWNDGSFINKPGVPSFTISNSVLIASDKGLYRGDASWHQPLTSQITSEVLSISKGISKVIMYGFSSVEKKQEWGIGIFANNDENYNDNIFLYADRELKYSKTTVPNKEDGPIILTFGTSTKYIKIFIDYSKIAEGSLLNSTSPVYIFSQQVFIDEPILNAIHNIESQMDAIPKKESSLRSLRVSVAGSSITWGDGWLGQGSYVGQVEDYLRNTLATTLHGAYFSLDGTTEVIENELLYKGKATLLSGVSSSASFEMYGDEISFCIPKERVNDGASIVDLYVDGTLHDTFSTYNNSSYHKTTQKRFSGDGHTLKFDLGEAFTYNHTLKIDGVAVDVRMNYSPENISAYENETATLIVRTLSEGNRGAEVHHFLYFKTPPENGTNIVLNFSAGESIMYTKSTVGQINKEISSRNESSYGDGNTSFDPANPNSFSSGLDFRQTDERSIHTWKFNSLKNRTFKLIIKSLDKRAPNNSTPKCYLNFATNRMHKIQNAGIGGWDTYNFLNDKELKGLDDILRFQPDIMILESSTNDDWYSHENKAYKTDTGLTKDTIKNSETVFFYNSVESKPDNNYTVQDTRINITDISEYTATLESTNGEFNIEKGDIITLGDYKNDIRRLVSRRVSAWDLTTYTVTWERPITDDEVIYLNTIYDLIGEYCTIMNSSRWTGDVNTIIDKTRKSLPNVQIILGTGGFPNIRSRRLEGYRELAENICANKDVYFVDFYGETLRWQYTQKQDTPLYLNGSKSLESTGNSEYDLYISSGNKAHIIYALPNCSVKVDGIERLNKGCYIVGGYKAGWPDSIEKLTISNYSYLYDTYKLVFTDDIPPKGAEISIYYSSVNWSGDNTHPSEIGDIVFGKAIKATLPNVCLIASSKPGIKLD